MTQSHITLLYINHANCERKHINNTYTHTHTHIYIYCKKLTNKLFLHDLLTTISNEEMSSRFSSDSE